MANQRQMAKFINGGGKGCKLLGLEGYFSVSDKNPAEATNLCRFVLRANDTTGEAPLNLTANIPVSEVPAILELAKIALEDYATGHKREKFHILEGQAKPKQSDKNDEGTLLYTVSIAYDSSRRYPVIIKVENCRTEVKKVAGGALRYSTPKTPQSEIVYSATVKDFYNSIAHLDTMYKTWCVKAAIDGAFGDVI